MSSADLTREWLRNVLRPYPSRDLILPEVLEILKQRRTLSVKTDAFSKFPPDSDLSTLLLADLRAAFDSGQTALLILVHGTLPINYRGATYQIPLHLWIPHSYPRDPPMMFVVPTKEIGVRKGREVEPGGRVREEIANEWWRSWQDKSIDILLRQLISVFSATPPVFARPPEPVSSSAEGISASLRDTTGPTGRPPTQYGDGYGAGPSSESARAAPQPPPPPARPGFATPGAQIEHLPQYRTVPNPPPQTFAQSYPPSPSRQASASYSPYPQSSSSVPPQSPPLPHRPPQIPPQQSSHPPTSPAGASVPQRPYPAFPSSGGPSRDIAESPRIPPRPAQIPQRQRLDYALEQFPPLIPDADGYQPQGWSQAPNGNYQIQNLTQPHDRHYAAPQPPDEFTQPPRRQYAQSPSDSYAQPPAFQYAEQQADQYQLQGRPSQPPQVAVLRQPQADLLSSPSNSFTSLPDISTAATSPPPIPPSKPPPPSLLHLHSILLPHLSALLPPLLHSLQANRGHLIERHEDLVSGELAIRDEMARLDAVKKVCDAVGKRMGDVVAKAEERVVEMEGRGEVSVDEVVCGISIVHNQLIDLVAEDNALEDTIYHLTRALDTERIDLDRFLKSIRSLAREQYMKRALIERILQGMGQRQGW